MTKYLVDANVLSEPTKQLPQSSVVNWLANHETDLVVNPIILGELEYGILLLPKGRRRTRLLQWFEDGVARLHVLDMNRDTAKIWAEILAEIKRKGRAMPLKDSLIAATAVEHNLTLATRNIEDYRHTGVALVNPFEV